jgi:hypothetical protein
MKQRASRTLQKELTEAGASPREVGELTILARELGQMERQPAATPARSSRRLRSLAIFGGVTLGGIAIGMALVIFSQTVLPGSPLYAVQKLSDSVAISADSSYRGTVMMKRAQQVQQLVAGHASSGTVMATLADYRHEAAAYKAAGANYAVFEYCKSSLQKAAAIAPASQRQAINASLESLQSV